MAHRHESRPGHEFNAWRHPGAGRPGAGGTWVIVGLALALVVMVLPVAAVSQVVELTVDPAMVRGPADAPVTIVEFADYQ